MSAAAGKVIVDPLAQVPPELREQISDALFTSLETAGLADLMRAAVSDLPVTPIEAHGLGALADALYNTAYDLQQTLTQIHRSTETKD